jgi:hypothetical protein
MLRAKRGRFVTEHSLLFIKNMQFAIHSHSLQERIYYMYMGLFLTPGNIIITTLAAFIVGGLWYSPFLFMKAWLKGEGLPENHKQNLGLTYQIQIQLYSFVAHGIMVTVLALLFDVIGVQSMQLAVSLALLIAFGFIVTTKFIELVYNPNGKHYEKRSQIRFLVYSGYYLTVMTVMSSVLFLVAYMA